MLILHQNKSEIVKIVIKAMIRISSCLLPMTAHLPFLNDNDRRLFFVNHFSEHNHTEKWRGPQKSLNWCQENSIHT